MRLSFLPAAAAALAIGACGAPPGAVRAISPDAARAPEPTLLETARFDAALSQAGPDAERLEADRGELAVRAAALRERAAALGAPVIAGSARERLEQGVAVPPPVPAPVSAPVPAAGPDGRAPEGEAPAGEAP